MASMPGTAAGASLVSTPRLPRPPVASSHYSLRSQCRSDVTFLGSSESSFMGSSSTFGLLSVRKTGRRNALGHPNRRPFTTNVKSSATMNPSPRAFLYRAFIARPSIHAIAFRRGFRFLGDYRARKTLDIHYLRQLPRRKSSLSGLLDRKVDWSYNSTDDSASSRSLDHFWAELRRSRNYSRVVTSGIPFAIGISPVLNSVQHAKELAHQHQPISASNTTNPVTLSGSKLSAIAIRSSPNALVSQSRPVSRTVRVAAQAGLKEKNHITELSGLPQYSPRVGKLSTGNQSLHLEVGRQSLDMGITSKSVEPEPSEAWERAAEKLGFGPVKSLSAAGYGEVWSEPKPVNCFTSSSVAVAGEKSLDLELFRSHRSAGEEKTERLTLFQYSSQSGSEPFKLPEYVTQQKSELFDLPEQTREHKQSESYVGEPEGCESEKPLSRRKTSSRKVSTDASLHEVKPKTKRKSAPVRSKQKAAAKAIDISVPPVTEEPVVESSSFELQAEPQTFSNDAVMVIDSVEKATMIVEKLMGEYKNLVHACDTEVAEIDVKKESPVGHGRITCFSIYCGPLTNFGDGKNRIWVDVLDGGEDVLKVFKRYFEDPCIKKVWHNYSFDKHILSRHGILAQGFYADTMHLARLYDSARRGAKGGYSLEVLSADENVMDGYVMHFRETDGVLLAGKKSMKDLFGKANLRKDGKPGKLKVVPPVEEIQRGEEWRESWIHYSTFDAVCTWRLWQSLQQKLKSTPWNVADLRKNGSMYDFYEKYWRPFGEVLVQMEADGMLVNCDHLAAIEKTARDQQQKSVSRFRKWAAKYCPDAAEMNVGSDAQIRQFLFGGSANRKDVNQVLPMERVFSVPNTEGFIEEGKKVPRKTRPIVIRGLRNYGIAIPVDTYTSSGWPAVGGAAIKALAGKVAIDYTDLESVSDEEVLEDMIDSVLTSAGVEFNDKEDLSVYGKAHEAFGCGQEGKEACMALAALCEVASINTLLSNFIEPLQGNDIKSASDGRVHCSLNINTETGRLSARRPSLQNQPALEKDRYKIREAFVAAPGKRLIVADYGQLELRLLAHLAKCRSMKAAFKAGGDFHSRTAMNMYPHVREAVEKERVLLEWEGQEKPPAPLLKDVFGSERRKAKMLNFSIAYGKTAMGLAKDWKVSIEEARATVDLWYSDRPEVLAWQKERKREAHEFMRVHTLLGRARHLPDVRSSNSLLRSHMERAAINTPVQGSAADVAMCAMLEINRNVQLRDLGWKLLLQVHDEVILEGPEESAEIAKDLVIKSMMYPFDGENVLDVELAVDADHASNWYAAK